MRVHRSFSILGSIALVNFSDKITLKDKKKFAEQILSKHNNIKTVLEKSENFKGRLRKMQTKHLSGEKNKEVFVMFAGVAPFSIVIAKNSKNVGKVYSNEINREANKYAELNVERNKVKDKVELVNGDVKKVAEKLKQKGKKFDYIIMPRPNLKETFLKQAFDLSKKGTKIVYYGFCKVDEVKDLVEDIKEKAKQSKKKIKILKTKPAGEIAPYKIRVRVDFSVL
jgi:tRNA G37 N-methylase Trm5